MENEAENARKELFELLQNNPELRKFQAIIGNSMDKAKEEDRLKILTTFIQYNLSDLTFEMMELKKLLIDRSEIR